MLRVGRLGFPHREIAAAAEVAHATVRAIVTRAKDLAEQTSHASGSTNEAPARQQ